MANWKTYLGQGDIQVTVNLDNATMIRPNPGVAGWTRIDFQGSADSRVIVCASVQTVVQDAHQD